MTAWTRQTIELAQTALVGELPAAVALRHELHANPDLSGVEEQTARRLLAALNVDDAPDVAGGRLVRLGGPGLAVGLRAELDALPVVERTGLEWAAMNGAGHVCGHDVHMAALVAVARALRTSGQPVPMVAVLQPREEATPSGAADLIASDELAAQQLGAMIGVHVQPRIPSGTYSCMPGVVNASSDDFTLVFSAHGGHAGYPHTSGDPVLAAAEIVVALQGVVARQIDPLHSAVVTVGAIHGGNAGNVIPDSTRVLGTVRAFDAGDRAHLLAKVRQVANQTAERHSCVLDCKIEPGEPPLANDTQLAALTGRWIESTVALTGVELRSCGSDDFAYYGSHCPSAMVFYGVGDASTSSPGLHNARFAPPDEDVAGVARTLLAGYFAGCELILGPPADLQ